MIFNFDNEESKENLKKHLDHLKNKKIVFTNGCFDIIHTGHVRYLKSSAAHGDILIVGVNSDASVRQNKGEGRPINSEYERCEILTSLECVDIAVIFNDLTPEKIIKFIIPQVLAKGDEYRKDQIIGADFVEENGGIVARIPMVKGVSTTSIIEKSNSDDKIKRFNKITGVIPSRYASTRLPGKPLLKINDKPLVQWVYDACLKSKKLTDIVVATDDIRISDAVTNFGGKCSMTSENCKSGTDRVMEIAISDEAEVFVNIQGDEPLIKAEIIDKLIEFMENNSQFDIVTAAAKIEDEKEFHDPNAVKVVFDKNGKALYFSRSAIPYDRDEKFSYGFKHIGIYLYQRKALMDFARTPQSTLEVRESLEQLRALENGMNIGVMEINYVPLGVDTEEDLIKVRELLEDK